MLLMLMGSVFQQHSAASRTDLDESLVSLRGTKSPEMHVLQRSHTTAISQARPCLFQYLSPGFMQTIASAGRMQDKVCVFQIFRKLLEFGEIVC